MRVRAAVQLAPNAVEVQELALTDAHRREPGAILRVEASGMCGSDYEQYSGELAKVGFHGFPVIPGHEPVGIVESIDPETARRWDVQEGDRVAVEPFGPCGVCSQCTDGAYHLCRSRFLHGFTTTDVGSGLWGGYAERMQLRPQSVVHKIPDGVSARDAVLFNPLGAGFEWAVRAAGTRPGDSVLVLGPGQRGLASVVAAREAGAASVIVTGRGSDAHRLELARRFGATATIDVDTEDTVARVLELTGGRGVDRAVDTSPYATQPVLDAVASVCPGGTVVIAGLKARQLPGVDIDQIVLRDLTVRGVMGVRSWAYRQAIRVIAGGRYPLHLMHTHTFDLDSVAEGILTLTGRIESRAAVHVTILPNGEDE